MRAHPGLIVLGAILFAGGGARAWIARSVEAQVTWLLVWLLGVLLLEVARRRRGLVLRERVRVSLDARALTLGEVEIPRDQIVATAQDERSLIIERRGLRRTIELEADARLLDELGSSLGGARHDLVRLALSPLLDRGWLWLVGLLLTSFIPIAATLEFGALAWMDSAPRVAGLFTPLTILLVLSLLPCRVELAPDGLRRCWLFGVSLWRFEELRSVEGRTVDLGEGRRIKGLSIVTRRGRRHRVLVLARRLLSEDSSRDFVERVLTAWRASRVP